MCSVQHGTEPISHYVVVIWLLLDVMTGHAQQLSIRRYDFSDGLAHNVVTSIYQDAKGYLWFGTFEGLSRFDGYRFINYDTRDGLGHVITNHVAEDRQGRLWVATNGGGVSRLIDDSQESGIRDQGLGVRGQEPDSKNLQSAIRNLRGAHAEIHQLSGGRDGWLEQSQPDVIRLARQSVVSNRLWPLPRSRDGQPSQVRRSHCARFWRLARHAGGSTGAALGRGG